MITRLRTPWLAALLLLASPALGGLVLPVLHPCAVEAAGAGAAAGHHGHGGHGDPAGDEGESTEACTCVGSCHVPALDLAPRIAAPVAILLPAVTASSRIGPRTATPVARHPLDLLPPSNAPPIA